MYDKGYGVKQDNVRAYIWYDIAVSLGYNDAKDDRDMVAKKLTPSQIERLVRLARKCVRKNYKGC